MNEEGDQRRRPSRNVPDEPPRSNAATWIGAALILLLIIAGVWVLNRIDDSKRAQECLESGRRNCRIIEPAR